MIENLNNEILLKTKNLSKSYKKKPLAINSISIELNKGEVIGLLGPNGAGKTTVIKCITGLTYPDEGEIYLNGNSKSSQFKNSISIVLEGNRNLYWKLTVKENIDFFMTLNNMKYTIHKERIEEKLIRFNLEKKIDELVGNLSRGMQQKLALLIATLDNAPLIILDEPTLGLDIGAIDELVYIIEDIRKDNRSILISSHDMRFVERTCKSVIFMKEGKVIYKSLISELSKLSSTRYMTLKTQPFNLDLFNKIEAESIEKEKDFFRFKILVGKSYINSTLNTLINFDIKIINIVIKDCDLEDVFRTLT